MIAVAGSTGFLGSAVMNELSNAGIVALGIARNSTLPPASHHQIAQVDLAHDVDRLQRELDRFRVTCLIHLALVSKPTFDHSPALAASGVEAIDHTLIEACRRSSTLQTIILASSAAVYGDRHPQGYRIPESGELAPGSIYGQIKLAQEKRWCSAALIQRLVTARVFNLIGPGEPTSYVCSAISHNLTKLKDGDALPIRSSASTRDFCDVRDVSRALIAIASLGADAPATVNICSGVPTTIAQLADIVVRVSGRNVRVTPDNAGAESRSLGDPGLLRSTTKWRQQLDLEQSASSVWRERSQAPV